MQTKIGSIFVFICCLCFISCGFDPSSLLSNSGNFTCSMPLNTGSWQQAYSPNINIFPSTYNYAAVSASTSNCSSFFSDSKDIQISLNLNSSVSGYTGQQMVFAAIYGGSRSFIANDYSYNFNSGSLNGGTTPGQGKKGGLPNTYFR